MGSLSKVQIKQDKETGNVDMNYFADEISKYIDKSSNTKYFETTPKLDGCSFSAEFTVDENHNYKFISCATRGDGNYGTDISHWIKPKILKEWTKIKECCQDILTPMIFYVLEEKFLYLLKISMKNMQMNLLILVLMLLDY